METPKSGFSSLTFHEETKHSELSVRSSGHYLDWDNRPYPFKVYEKPSITPLPRDFPHPTKAALDATGSTPQTAGPQRLDVSGLAELLFFSAGLTRKMNTRAGVYHMRAAPATGALYPIELYVICSEINGLGEGVYHFNPLEFSLVKLRQGDYASAAAEAAARSGASPVTLAFTSIAWRNAWKYEARSYRHWFWDSGVIAANLLATASAENLSVQIDAGFDDSQISKLLGLKGGKEAPVVLAHVGGCQRVVNQLEGPLAPLSLEVKPLSREETEYPIVWKTNS